MFSTSAMRQSYRSLESDISLVSIEQEAVYAIRDDSESDGIVTSHLPVHRCNDVIFNKLDKNSTFYQTIKEHELVYKQAKTKAEQHAIAHKIYKIVTSNGGEFLEEVGCTTKRLSPTKAMIKVNQTLRTASRKACIGSSTSKNTSGVIELRKARSKSLFSPELSYLQESMQVLTRSFSDPSFESADTTLMDDVPPPMPELSRQCHVVSEEL